MKLVFAILLWMTINAPAQNSKTNCDYKIEKIADGQYKTTITHYDSLDASENCFKAWMNSGRGKPDGQLIVLDENGKKRRLAIYKGGIRVGKHLEWYSTGELYSETNWETDMYFNSKRYY